MEWLSNAGTYVLVALGIGGVIFLHECGHFFAARWCGVRVECFSLGFGPKLLGWKRGTTTYQLALLPLGGYVKMAGEEASGGSPAPDDLTAKSVGQRFFIYSGGVLANVLTCLVVFPILFAVGVPFQEPIVGPVAPGSPAWNAGIEPGSRVLRVNDRHIDKFTEITTEVALGSPEHAEVEYVDPSGARRVVAMVPTKDEALGIYSIGLGPGWDPAGKISVAKHGAAERAGLKEGDRLLAIDGAPPGWNVLETMSLFLQQGAPLKGRFLRDDREFEATIAPEEDPEQKTMTLGVQPETALVAAVRASPETRALGLAAGDRILAVNGTPVRRSNDLLRILVGAQEEVRVEFEHAGAPLATVVGPLDADAALRLAHDLALTIDPASTRAAVLRGSPAERAGLRDGDRIVAIDGAVPEDWAAVRSTIQKKKAGPLAITVARNEAGVEQRLELNAELGTWKLPAYGFAPQDARYTFQVSGPVAAVEAGWSASWNFLEESWLTLKRIFNREVSGDNLGGIITIGVVSHRFAEDGLVSLLFFLCMLSMNLAFLNVLPIPVLDGGHLLFLLIEKVKGSPVSERVMGYSQMVGIVLILSLMVYVTFNDVMRWIVR